VGSRNRAYNVIRVRRKLEVLPHITHMTFYSDESKVEAAAKMATKWFVERLWLTTRVLRARFGRRR
jgi:hypothetical protein